MNRSNKKSAEKLTSDKHLQYRQPLGDQVSTMEQEARMVLPGIQTLFGFQLIVVFNQGFKANLTQEEQIVHLIAIILVAISAVLVVAPAAYHRQANHQISEHFIELSSRFLAWAMAPLALGTCMDIYLVTKMIVLSDTLSLLVTGLLGIVYTWTWFVFPKVRGSQIKTLPTHELTEPRNPL
jgi:hypothetical protein